MLAETTATLEALKSQLMKSKDQAAIKPDLYAHLNEVCNRIINYHPYDALDRFEEISTLVKETNFNIADPAHDYEVNGDGAEKSRLTNRQAIEYIERAKTLLKEIPGAGVAPADMKLLTTDKQCNIPNF
jgi:hypothetical protein